MSSSATGVGMPICFLGTILLILTQKSSQKFGDVLGIGDGRMLLAKLQLQIFSISIVVSVLVVNHYTITAEIFINHKPDRPLA